MDNQFVFEWMCLGAVLYYVAVQVAYRGNFFRIGSRGWLFLLALVLPAGVASAQFQPPNGGATTGALTVNGAQVSYVYIWWSPFSIIGQGGAGGGTATMAPTGGSNNGPPWGWPASAAWFHVSAGGGYGNSVAAGTINALCPCYAFVGLSNYGSYWGGTFTTQEVFADNANKLYMASPACVFNSGTFGGNTGVSPDGVLMNVTVKAYPPGSTTQPSKIDLSWDGAHPGSGRLWGVQGGSSTEISVCTIQDESGVPAPYPVFGALPNLVSNPGIAVQQIPYYPSTLLSAGTTSSGRITSIYGYVGGAQVWWDGAQLTNVAATQPATQPSLLSGVVQGVKAKTDPDASYYGGATTRPITAGWDVYKNNWTAYVGAPLNYSASGAWNSASVSFENLMDDVSPGLSSGGPPGLRAGDSTTLGWGLHFDGWREVIATVFQGFDNARNYLGNWLVMLQVFVSFSFSIAVCRRIYALGAWGLSIDLGGVGGVPLPDVDVGPDHNSTGMGGTAGRYAGPYGW